MPPQRSQRESDLQILRVLPSSSQGASPLPQEERQMSVNNINIPDHHAMAEFVAAMALPAKNGKHAALRAAIYNLGEVCDALMDGRWNESCYDSLDLAARKVAACWGAL